MKLIPVALRAYFCAFVLISCSQSSFKGDNASQKGPPQGKPPGEVPDDQDPDDDKPTDDKPTDDKPTDDKPTDDKPTDDKPTDDKPTDDKPTDDKDPEVIHATCTGNPEKVLTAPAQKIVFEERKGCPSFPFTFPQGVTVIDSEEAWMNASESQNIDIKIPEGTMCDISMKSPDNAELHYDDFLILTLEKQMLFMTNNIFMPKFQQDAYGVYEWDFAKIKDQHIDDFERGPYCLGSGCLKLPLHDKKGPVSLNFTSKDLSPISARIAGKPIARMSLIATGDNDQKDCFHSRLELTVEIKYLPKE